MDQIYVLRVFVNEKGQFGNPVAVVVDEYQRLDRLIRQRMAMRSGLSETVFINNKKETRISIYSPKREIAFAGHAAVGAAHFFYKVWKDNIHELNGIEGPIDTWQEEGLTWVRGKLKSAPEWNLKQVKTVAEVESLALKDTATLGHAMIWSWIDEEKGEVRARTFAPDWGIAEDEANGSGAMRLAALLKRDLTICHGKGSLIYVRPDGPGFVQLGGRVKI